MSEHSNAALLRFLHIGDLHITESHQQNHRDLVSIVKEVNEHVVGKIDFVFQPGDIAEHGQPEQFGIAFDEMSRLNVPWHVVPGDHDFEPGSLDHFYRILRRGRLPNAQDINGKLCIFLDIVSAGTGGPNFRLGRAQISWLRERLEGAKRDGRTAIVFMHAYPADLGEEAVEVARLIDDSPVVLVDMGHTHYNELSNDGRTIYAATRSTGQIEEGDVGYSFVAVDRDVVSWRFKKLDSPWPFVMITSPADKRLVTGDTSSPSGSTCEVRASVWGAKPIVQARLRVDTGPWLAMASAEAGMQRLVVQIPQGASRLSVHVVDDDGGEDTDTIEIDYDGQRRQRHSSGSDAGSIGAWPERHIFGTQLGPNRNGKKW